MDEMQAKIETWLQLIKLEKLQDVLQDMRTNFRVEPSEKLNDGIFRLLLRLCFMADKCNKQNSKVGQDIAELANFLCSLLIKVPNDNNFVKALFKIVQCLIAFNLYEDAENICCYLQPGILYNPQDDTINLLIKVLSLWRYSIYSMWLELKNESLNAENYNQLKSIMKYEMNMTQMVYKDYTKHLLEGINKHLDRIFMIDKDKKYFDDFCKYILEYLSGVQLYLDKDEKYKIYYHILRIICRVICETTNINNIKSSRKMLDTLFAYFEILTEDKECHQCFQQFQNFCMTLLVPMESLNNSAKDIQNVIYCNVNIAEKYGTKNLKCNAISIAEISEVVLEYWEKCIEIDNSMFKHLVNTGILLEIMNLFIHINTDEFYKEKKSTECKWCSNKLCIVKKDLHNFIATKCRCINLIFKFSLKTLPAKMCTLARKIMKQTVESIIFEIKECECKRWWQSWRTCRNIIYNIGILSEHIYEESVQLYSFLSTCIFQLKDFELNLKSDLENLKIKDFENIITFVLHRLSVVHCNNNMYKKAATACVLNALLTYNHSNTKAFHTWISIKKSAPEEITKMTMLECLKNDKEKIKSELGFSVDTLKYDPIALCLCEARNLLEEQIAFTNGIATLLKTLKKLQPSNQYAHTVLLLGYYFLGFKYDSSILKYYEQAIHDLKKNKSNSVAILCLEANLSLFMFAEELRVMRKQTHLEMENTKFAIYAPKLKEPMETNSSNVVAAYTMINIKKDTNLMLCLQKSLKKWKQLFECYFVS
ncbi:hypothetical protein PUN28_014095 [Cardiocondyla obscurior]|uniref:Uncharacterized protein n=1 Tax=Cardiocondyla obscurior TaxID=286306 RepID=A0AAW2EZL0_9HYME